MDKNPLLLPSGFYDLLPPEARKESHATARLLDIFASFGYAQVSPPLLEFEASLLSGRGEALSLQTFRVSDPLSQMMMGFRADLTLQIARIAHSRLAVSARPLRLCYAGAILQRQSEPLRNERQLTQAGIEIIGADSAQADAETIIVAAESLAALGIRDVSVDINLPGLLSELCPEAKDDAALRTRIRDAVTRKDTLTISSLPIAHARLLAALTEAAGTAEATLERLQKLGLTQTDRLADVTARVRRHCPALPLTIDPVEYRGFDYHQGIGFSIFAKGLRHELGRGGRYVAEGEQATGFTLYVTHLLRLLPIPEERRQVLVTTDTPIAKLHALRAEQWATVYAVTANPREEAKRLGYTYIEDL